MFKKLTIIICVLLLYYGCWYSFEFINPWIGILMAIILTALLGDYIYSKITEKKIRSKKKIKININ
jgi:hypothetical protein